MPHIITKPIVLVCGSRSIQDVSIGRYIRPSSCAAIVSGGANGVDTLVEQWAKRNKLEFIAFLPNYKTFGKRAPLKRNEDMVNFSDVVIAFWDGKSHGTKYTIDYAKKLGRRVIVHIIEE